MYHAGINHFAPKMVRFSYFGIMSRYSTTHALTNVISTSFAPAGSLKTARFEHVQRCHHLIIINHLHDLHHAFRQF